MVGLTLEGIDLHIQALNEWNSKLSQILNIAETDYSSDDETITKCSKELESNKIKCLAIFLIANISFVNSVIDSDIFKALCISFFDKNYHLPYDLTFIFTFLIEKFKLDFDTDECSSTPLKRGEYLFRLLRAFHSLKSSHDIITMIFVCIARHYGICSRIISKYPPDLVIDSNKRQRIWCEFFDTKERLWKCVDFAIPKFDNQTHKYRESSEYLASIAKKEKDDGDSNCQVNLVKDDYDHMSSIIVVDRQIEVESESKALYKDYLYIQRNNRLFVYRNLDEPVVCAIVVFPKYAYKTSRMLFVKEYPFEANKKIERLKLSFSEANPNPFKQKKTIKTITKNVFILSCNIAGIVSEITSKYVQKELSYTRTSSFIKWFNELLACLNQRRIQSHIDNDNKNKDLAVTNIDVINANLLESVDSKFINNLISTFPIPNKKTHFINHPIYVLKSQIKRNYILKSNSVPVANFGDDLVYVKSDLLEVRTKYGWYKDNRQIKPDSTPIQLHSPTHNKNMEYYTKDQTEPLKQDNIDDFDKFTINLSGKRYVPENSVYIRSKEYANLEKICKRNKIFFKRAYSSLHYEDGSLRPKIDGVVIKSQELKSFLKLYDEQIESIAEEQLSEERTKMCKYWKNVFKTLLNSPPVNKVESTSSVKKSINKHTNKFLNQLI